MANEADRDSEEVELDSTDLVEVDPESIPPPPDQPAEDMRAVIAEADRVGEEIRQLAAVRHADELSQRRVVHHAATGFAALPPKPLPPVNKSPEDAFFGSGEHDVVTLRVSQIDPPESPTRFVRVRKWFSQENWLTTFLRSWSSRKERLFTAFSEFHTRVRDRKPTPIVAAKASHEKPRLMGRIARWPRLPDALLFLVSVLLLVVLWYKQEPLMQELTQVKDVVEKETPAPVKKVAVASPPPVKAVAVVEPPVIKAEAAKPVAVNTVSPANEPIVPKAVSKPVPVAAVPPKVADTAKVAVVPVPPKVAIVVAVVPPTPPVAIPAAAPVTVASPAPLAVCTGTQVHCPEGLAACIERVTLAHDTRVAKGACTWKCSAPCALSPTGSFQPIPPLASTALPPDPVPAPITSGAAAAGTPDNVCPEGKALCILKHQIRLGENGARGACWRCVK